MGHHPTTPSGFFVVRHIQANIAGEDDIRWDGPTVRQGNHVRFVYVVKPRAEDVDNHICPAVVFTHGSAYPAKACMGLGQAGEAFLVRSVSLPFNGWNRRWFTDHDAPKVEDWLPPT